MFNLTKDYEDAVSEMAKVEMQRKIVEEKAEQLKISTKAQAEAREMQADGEAAYVRKMAEAEAEAMKLKGASENEVREELEKSSKPILNLSRKFWRRISRRSTVAETLLR